MKRPLAKTVERPYPGPTNSDELSKRVARRDDVARVQPSPCDQYRNATSHAGSLDHDDARAATELPEQSDRRP